ncbi:MAG: GAF domain-containing protein [Candidatus Methylomirabilales bacterium]
MEQEGRAAKGALDLSDERQEGQDNPCILVVDDEPAIVRVLQVMLERQGFTVLVATSGETAIELIKVRPIHLVVLDIMMPEVDGVAVCRHIKADPSLRHIPIILLTAKDSLQDKVFGLEMGADDYMTKPFSGEELVARINAHLRIRRMAREVLQRNRELSLLNALTEAGGHTLDQEEVARAALEKIGELEEVKSAYILLQDPGGGGARVVGHDLPASREQTPATIEEEVLREGRLRCYPDVSQAPDLVPVPIPAGAGSFLIIPLTAPGWVRGALGLFSRLPTRFGEEEMRLFTAVGRHLTIALANAALYSSLARQVRQVQALYHVSASPAVDQVIRTIVECFLEAMRVDRCAITLHAGGEAPGHLIVGYDRSREDPWVQRVELSLDRYPEIRRVLETQQPLIIPDMAKEPLLEPVRDILLSLQIRSMVTIPLLAQEQILGVVTLSSRGPARHFTRGEIDFCQSLANQAAFVIANTRLYEETLKGKEYLGTILEINKKIGMTTETSDLLQTIADEAARLLQVDGVGFRLVEGDFLVSAAMSGVARHIMLRPRLKIGESLSGQAAAENHPIIVSDVVAASSWVKEHHTAAIRQGVKSAMFVPVRFGGRVIGVLNIYAKGNRQFTQRDVDLAMVFADQAAIALERTRLLQETQARAEKLRALIEVGKAVSSSLELEAVLHTIAGAAVPVMRATACNVMLLDETGEQLLWKAQVGFPQAYRRIGRSSVRASLAGQVVTEEKPLAVVDRTTDPRAAHPDLAKEHGLTSFLGVPVKVREKIIGVISVSTKEPRHFTEEEISLLSTFADQAAIAIGNARVYQQIQRYASTLAELYKSTLQVSASLDVDETLHKIVENVVAASEAASSNIILFDELGQISHLVGWQVGEIEARPDGLSRQVWETGRPVVLPDFATTPPGMINPQLLALGRRAAVCLPLQVREQVRGVMWVHYNEPRRLVEEDLHLLSSFANQAAIAIENAHLFAETRRLANTDELTGLYNHRYFYQLLGAEVKRALRYDRSLSLIMLDIDHFKQFNDRHGHLVGDEALRRLAQTLRKNSRGVDMVARYGGEEFAIILPETDLGQAAIQAERLRAAAAEQQWPEGQLTISLGVAALTENMTRVEDLVREADWALYQAKAAGRNQVCLGSPPSR